MDVTDQNGNPSMLANDAYALAAISDARAAIKKGHADPANLRKLLIWTTATPTAPLVKSYFEANLQDERLLASLIEIALEGEDSGDAPWAAANMISAFPAKMLLPHVTALHALSHESWDYLSRPAKLALAKIKDSSA